MLGLPPLIRLRAFGSAARRLSFKSAAEELGVTPMAVCHRIHLLEEYCGQRLFWRQPRALSRTAAGQQLFAMLHEGFNQFAEALGALSEDKTVTGFRVTTTSAFAARWLLPKLPFWRQAHPGISLDTTSTYDVLDLSAGGADVALRYARTPPTDGMACELFHDTFHVVGSPSLVGGHPKFLQPAELADFPRIVIGWPPRDAEAPTWQRREREAKVTHHNVPRLADTVSLRFKEELHAIEAANAGQGIAICSDILINEDLASGKLQRLSEITLPSFGFYIIHSSSHPKKAAITVFSNRAQSLA